MEQLRIGEVARRAGVGVETIRFYEREGLIAQPAKPRSGFRAYPPDIVRRVRFILRAKELGFSLKEISDLLELRVDRNRSCADVRKRAREKIADVDVRIATLQTMRRALEELAVSCVGKGPTSECPILDAIEGVGEEDDGSVPS